MIDFSLSPTSSAVRSRKQIETSNAIDPITMTSYFGLQQVRFPPTLLADTPAEALSRLFMLPGAHYSDPKFSWKFEVAPAGLGFLDSVALGARYEGDLFLGEARTFLDAGYLFRLRLNRTRRQIAVRDSAIEDKVADNPNKFDITESESLLFGRGFGVGTDIQTAPTAISSSSHSQTARFTRSLVPDDASC